jgi:transcriptional regulator with XRE-family HTH domain
MNIEDLRKRKKELDITFEELSEKTDIAVSTLKEIFRGATKSPRIDTMQAIEKALNLDIQAPPTLSEAEQRLLSAFRNLEPQMQEIILNLVDNSARDESKKNSS